MPAAHRLTLWTQRHPALAFVLLAYGFTWLLWTPVGYLAGGDRPTEQMLQLVGGWGPALAAIVVARTGTSGAGTAPLRRRRLGLFAAAAVLGLLVLIWRFTSGGRDVLTGEAGAGQGTFTGLPLVSVLLATGFFAFVVSRVRSPDGGVRSLAAKLTRWRVAPTYYAFALLIFPIVALAGALLAGGLGQPVYPPTSSGHDWQVWLPALASSFLLTVLFTGGVPEELGWRGFLLPELQKRFTPLTASLIIGPVWTFWHLPLYLTGPRPLAALVPFLVLVTLLSILYTWLYNRSGGSVLLVVLLHAAFNNYLVVAPRTWFALVPLVLLAAGLVVMDRMYRSTPEPAPAAPAGLDIA